MFRIMILEALIILDEFYGFLELIKAQSGKNIGLITWQHIIAIDGSI